MKSGSLESPSTVCSAREMVSRALFHSPGRCVEEVLGQNDAALLFLTACQAIQLMALTQVNTYFNQQLASLPMLYSVHTVLSIIIMIDVVTTHFMGTNQV